MSTENKDIANEMKKVTELDPEELETIAGGREPRYQIQQIPPCLMWF